MMRLLILAILGMLSSVQVATSQEPKTSPDQPSGLELVDVRKIWDRAPHNAFTDLIRFQDRWYCVFREGKSHVSPDGALRVISSEDTEDWKSVALLTAKDGDLRDAKISRTSDGQLMLAGAKAFHQPAEHRHVSLAWFSADGQQWSQPTRIGVLDNWLWRVQWFQGKAYGFGYNTGDRKRGLKFFSSQDGKRFTTEVETVPGLGTYPNESSIVFRQDGTAICLLRQDGNPKDGLLGIAKPPYRDWSWKSVGCRIGGPDLIQIPDGRFICAVRLYDSQVRTSLCWLDIESGKLTEALKLPSGGDTSYAGLVWHDDQLYVSYYSSHESKTAVYLARVKVTELDE